MFLRLSPVIFIVILFIAATGQGQTGPWPKFRHDFQNSGQTPYTGPAAPVLYWTFATNDGIASSPSIGSNGTIYIGSGWLYTGASDSGLYAINPDGTMKWKFNAGNGIFSSPGIGPDGTVYFGSIDTYLYAVEDSVIYGKLRWKTDLGRFFILASPVVAPDGILYIGAPNFDFYALDPADGVILWTYSTNWCIISSAAVDANGRVYVGSKDHHVYAFNPSSNTPVWAFPTGTFYDGHLVDASPAIGADGTIYVGTDQYGAAGRTPTQVDTSFWAINPDGTIKWNLSIGNGVESSSALGPDGTVYFGSYDSCLYAVDDNGTHGTIKWKFPTNGFIDGSPAVDGDGHIYFGSRDSVLYALYPNGAVKWTYRLGGDIESSPTIDGRGYLYIGCFDGNLYCFGTGAPDVGVPDFEISPRIIAGESLIPTATIRNFRSAPREFRAACHIEREGSIIYADTIPVTLGDAEARQVSFAAWNTPAELDILYSLSIFVIEETDDNIGNNIIVRQTMAVNYICGDANGDDGVNVGDAVFVINYAFKGGLAPDPLASGDANCDGAVNVGDAVFLINYAFKGGLTPCSGCPD